MDVPPNEPRSSQRSNGPLRRVLRVMPALVAAAIFSHFAWYGLQPTLVERERLEAAAEDVHRRHAQLLRTEGELRVLEAALDDPLYRERVRRRAAAERDDRRGRALESAPPLIKDPSWFGEADEVERLTGEASARGGADGTREPRQSLVR